MRLGPARVYWTPWWDVDHHMYGCPIGVTVHTRRWVLMLRPFSGFAQGGDARGRTDFHGYDRTAKWLLQDNTPEKFARLDEGHDCRCRYCVWCLHDEETCRMIGGHPVHGERYVRRGVFVRHLWSYHVRERKRCGIRWGDLKWHEVDTED